MTNLKDTSKLKYKRVLLKLSGEALVGDVHKSYNLINTDIIKPQLFDDKVVMPILEQIKQLVSLGVTVGVVIGGGNIFRGLDKASEFGLQRANADYMGMLATIMNGIALKDFLSKLDVKSQLYSAMALGSVVNGYNRDKMLADLDLGSVAIFAGGTGNPFFTTDSAAAIRAIEMNADLLIKATKVDGVYDSDPVTNSNAKKYFTLSFNEAISKKLKVMDMSAFALCNEYKMKIQVCNIFETNVLQDIVCGKNIGTCIHHDES